MKRLGIFVFTLLMLSSGEMKEWPTHTVCRSKDFEIYYKSCDPFQDFGASFEPCSRVITDKPVLRLGLILRREINELNLALTLFINGERILHYDTPVCEQEAPRFSFCGRKKGEYVNINQHINPGFEIFPKGKIVFAVELFNEDNFRIACANVTVNSS